MDELPLFSPRKHLDLHILRNYSYLTNEDYCMCARVCYAAVLRVCAGVFMILHLSAGCNDIAR